jgi:hypothetical protein
VTEAGFPRLGLRVALPLLLLALATRLAWAIGASSPAVDWAVLGSGGAPAGSSSGLVNLNGTIGQSVIGASDGVQASLGAGFWYGARREGPQVYLPLVLQGYS